MNQVNFNMKKVLTRIAIAAFLSQSVPALASSGTEGASFLDIPVGAAPAALGSAYTALATNAYAPVWNPAGLGNLRGNELAGQHLSYLESMHYEFISFVHPLDKSRDNQTHRGLGFSVQYLGSGDIEGMSDQAQPTGTFSSYYASYNFSYGQTVTDKLSLGATAKMIHAKLDDVSANAYAGDIGGLYRLNEKTQLGATIVNLGTKLKFINEGDSLPLAFKLGGAFQPSSRYMGTAEIVVPQTGLASFHTGGQWRPVEMISLRAGYKTDTLKGLSPLAGLTMGMGLHFWGSEFAYAWAPYGDLGSAQYISLLARFGGEDEQKRNLIKYQKIKKHRSVQSRDRKDDLEPEYQQLMQLLSDDDSHMARTATKPASRDR